MKCLLRIIAAAAIAAAIGLLAPYVVRTQNETDRAPRRDTPVTRESSRDFIAGGSTADAPTGPYWDAVRARQKRSFRLWGQGRGFARSKAWDKAIVCYEKALRFDPANAFAFTGLGGAYAEKGEWRKAVANYRMVMYDWPGKKWGCSVSNDYDHLFEFTVALRNAGEEREARAVYAKAVRMAPGRVSTYLYAPDGVSPFDERKMTASIHLALSDIAERRMYGSAKEAGEHFRKRRLAEARAAVSAAPDYGPAHLMLSEALEDQAQIDASRRRDAAAEEGRRQSARAYRLAAQLGTGKTIFSPPMSIPPGAFRLLSPSVGAGPRVPGARP